MSKQQKPELDNSWKLLLDNPYLIGAASLFQKRAVEELEKISRSGIGYKAIEKAIDIIKNLKA